MSVWSGRWRWRCGADGSTGNRSWRPRSSTTPRWTQRWSSGSRGGAPPRPGPPHLDQLGDLWTANPPRVLRSGALGVRDLAALARDVDLEPPHAAWLAELALAAGLIVDDGELIPAFTPTPEFDVWRSRSAGARWASVAQAWWESPRAAYLVGTQGAGGATVGALGQQVRWPAIRGVRADVLREKIGRAHV